MPNPVKPTAIKKLEGNRGHRKLPKHEPQPDKTPPKCPYWLNYQAKAEWKRIIPELERLGLVTIVDRVALTAYCEAYSRWVRAAKEIQKGFTYEFMTKDFKMKRVKKPEVDIVRDSLNQVKAFCIEFGLTPSARSRMSVPGQIPKQDLLDEMLGTVQN